MNKKLLKKFMKEYARLNKSKIILRAESAEIFGCSAEEQFVIDAFMS